MSAESQPSDDHTVETSLAGSKWIRAGWITISIGFAAAFVCAVVLGQQIRSLERAFSSFHRWAQYVMLVGCILLAIGYRLRHIRRSAQW